MGLFDNLRQQAPKAANTAQSGSKTVTVTFTRLPETFEEFAAMPQAALGTPFDTAAMTILALCFYPGDKELSLRMLDFLRGPRPLSGYDKSFIADRFRDSDYVPRSYFEGANPQNDYLPAEPYRVTVSENPYSYQNQGCATLHIRSGGADNPRSVQLRLAKDGKWYLWEQFVLVGIRQPESSNPWA